MAKVTKTKVKTALLSSVISSKYKIKFFIHIFTNKIIWTAARDGHGDKVIQKTSRQSEEMFFHEAILSE